MWQAAGLVVLAMGLIVGSDMAGRVLIGLGFSPFFVAWMRFLLAAVVLTPVAGLRPGEWRLLADWRLVGRAALIAGGVACILTALRTEPVANVFGGFFVGPVVSYALAILLLREPLSPWRTALLGLSFVGVLVVVRPDFNMSAGMALAVLAGTFHGSYLAATRWLAGAFRPRFLMWSQLLIGTVLLTPLAVGPVPPVDARALWLLVLSAAGSATGNFILVMVNRTTPANIVAPFIYSQIVVAALLGFVVFREVPDAVTFAGLTIIVVAGASSAWVASRGR